VSRKNQAQVHRSLAKRSPSIAWADEHGWDLRRTSGGHVVALCPSGCCRVVMASSPSDHRGPKNMIALMRRCPGDTSNTPDKNLLTGKG
jgi:hypothetical protein